MATNTEQLQTLIKDFSRLSARDSVTPANLGYILDRIAGLLAQTVAQEDLAALDDLSGKVAKMLLCGTVVKNIGLNLSGSTLSLQQSVVDLTTGSGSSTSTQILTQATTMTAGLMTAAQAQTLDNAYKRSSKTHPQPFTLEAIGLPAGTALKITHPTASGYDPKDLVPYIFRRTVRRTKFGPGTMQISSQTERGKNCKPKKGWHVVGGLGFARVHDDYLYFDNSQRHMLHLNQLMFSPQNYSSSANTLLTPSYNPETGRWTVGWGKSSVIVNKPRTGGFNHYRLLRFEYAVAFGPEIRHGMAAVTPSKMLTPLVPFSVACRPRNVSDNHISETVPEFSFCV